MSTHSCVLASEVKQSLSGGASGKYSRMFPHLHGRQDSEGTLLALGTAGASMDAEAGTELESDNLRIPAGFPIFGQFIARQIPSSLKGAGLRTQRGLPKTHWLDASCVGASTPAVLLTQGIVPWLIGAQGRHSRPMCRTNDAGFPDKGPKATSVVGGFRTGDLVRAVVPPSSTKAGTYVGRMAIRATGSCNLQTAMGTIQGIHYRYCQPLQRADGYSYQIGPRVSSRSPSGDRCPAPSCL